MAITQKNVCRPLGHLASMRAPHFALESEYSDSGMMLRYHLGVDDSWQETEIMSDHDKVIRINTKQVERHIIHQDVYDNRSDQNGDCRIVRIGWAGWGVG